MASNFLIASILVTFALSSCATHDLSGPTKPGQLAIASMITPDSERQVYLSPTGFDADLITPDGIHVKTNGQYKTESQKRAAAATIDRYWHEVRSCAVQQLPPGDTMLSGKLIPEFPGHLSIEIANQWHVIEGPVSHRKMQAFPSQVTPGAWVTARREEEALLVEVVPELIGLGRQMAGELNLWLAGNTSALPTDLANLCASVSCIRFDYDNSPSEAFGSCAD
ncbi:MAG TPA: hypothetical protein VIX59_15065 [Candidatus Binataceae bacterium]